MPTKTSDVALFIVTVCDHDMLGAGNRDATLIIICIIVFLTLTKKSLYVYFLNLTLYLRISVLK